MALIMTTTAIVFIVARLLFFRPEIEKSDKGFLIFVVVVLTVIFGCRNALVSYGSDLNNYYRCFERAIELSREQFFKEDSFEKGYLWLNWILARVIKWPQFILFFQSAFCCGVTCRFIYKHTKDVLFSVLAFMSLGLMQFYSTGFRQAFAISICLIALELAENRKLIGFIITLLIAMSIHQTAIVFAIAHILVNIKTNQLTIIIDLVIGGVLSQVAPRLLEIGNDTFDKDYIMMFSGNKLGGLINILIYLIPILIIIFDLYFNKDLRYDQRTEDLLDYRLFHILIIGVSLYVLRYQANVLERISFYFTPVVIVMLPKTLKYAFSENFEKFVRWVFVLGMLFLISWRFKNFDYTPFWQ